MFITYFKKCFDCIERQCFTCLGKYLNKIVFINSLEKNLAIFLRTTMWEKKTLTWRHETLSTRILAGKQVREHDERTKARRSYKNERNKRNRRERWSRELDRVTMQGNIRGKRWKNKEWRAGGKESAKEEKGCHSSKGKW